MPASSPLRSLLLLVPACSLLWLIAGCSSESAKSEKPEFVLGNAVKPFDAPSLEELNKLSWTDGPVLDALDQIRQEQEKAGPPPVSVAEALELRNDSEENNEKILDTLGRVAPLDGAGVDYEQPMVRQVVGDLNSTNPLFMSSVTDFEFSSLTSIGVLNFNRRFEFFAPKEFVVSWQTSEDRMIDKFVLRDDLTWSDGKPLTAHDIEFSFRVIMSDHEQLVIPAVRQGPDQLLYAKAYDDQTIVFFHKEKLATRIENMLFPIIPKHIYEKSIFDDPSLKRSAHHTKYEDNPVTSGPYELSKRVRNQEFVVKRRESFYKHDGKEVRPQPYFKEVRVKVIEDMNTALLAMKAGDIEQIEMRPEQWSSQTTGDDYYAKNTKVTAEEWAEFHVVWNVKSPYFNDKRVRWAMSYAMDYDEMINKICRGLYQQSQGTFHPTSWMFPTEGVEPLKQDLKKAEDLLDEAGWVDDDGDGVREKEINGRMTPFEFQLSVANTETGIQIATLMKESLEQIGVIANVKPTEFVVLQDKLIKHEFDGSLGGWGTGTDPDTQENIFSTGAPRNYGQYSNTQVDELFQAGRRELDRAKRAEIYRAIHKQLWDDQANTWLYYRNSFFGFNKKLRGYNFSPRGPLSFSPGFDSIYAAGQP
jgi:peptide/nickel transport system substrate-binding protein